MPSFRFCQYRDLFGKPGTGIHSYKIAGIAVADVVLTALLAAVIHTYMTPTVHFWIIFVALVVLGEFLHFLVCVK